MFIYFNNYLTVNQNSSNTLKFTGSTTTYFYGTNSWGVSGTASKPVTIQSTNTNNYTFRLFYNYTSNYVNISKCTASGGTMTMLNSIDGGGNSTSIIFTTFYPTANGSFFLIFQE